MLLSSAGLLIRSFLILRNLNPGFSTANRLTMVVSLPSSRYGDAPHKVQAFQQIVQSVRRVPGVMAASMTSSLPIGGGGFYLGRVFLAAGQPEPPGSKDTAASWSVIQPDVVQNLAVIRNLVTLTGGCQPQVDRRVNLWRARRA